MGWGVSCLLCGNLSVARLVNAWRRSDDIYLRIAQSARMQSIITNTTSHQLCPRSSTARLVFVVCTQSLIRLGLTGWLAATSPGQSFQHLSISTCHRDEAPATHMNHLTLSIIAPRLSSSPPAYPRNIGTWIPYNAIVL